MMTYWEKRYRKLENAVNELYSAGYWTLNNMPMEDQVQLWANVQEATKDEG